MITETLQPITCFVSTKSEIPLDHAAPRAGGPRPGPRTALRVTTHHAPRTTVSPTPIIFWRLSSVDNTGKAPDLFARSPSFKQIVQAHSIAAFHFLLSQVRAE
jgi:hypothetical protein